MLKPGDHIYIYRYSPILYTHHGIVIESNKKSILVAHPIKSGSYATFMITDLNVFIGDLRYCTPFDIYDITNFNAFQELKTVIAQNPLHLIYIKKHKNMLPRNMIVENALNFVRSKKEYCLFTNNCEMFAEYCCTGESQIVSRQVIDNIKKYATGNSIIHNINTFVIDSLSEFLFQSDK
jgi:hypothetical protein